MRKFSLFVLKILYWILSLTWGALVTIPGLLCLMLLKTAGYPIERNGFGYVVRIGNSWGGVNLGPVSLIQKNYVYKQSYEDTRRHEFGHSIQNIMFGPLHVFLVCIPSVIRYWYQTIRDKKGLPNKPYLDIWFEYDASVYGALAVDAIEEDKLNG